MEEEKTPQHYQPATPASARLTSASLVKIIVPIAVVGFLLLLVYTFLSGLRSGQKNVNPTPTPSPAAVTTPSTQQVQLPLPSSAAKTQTIRAGLKTEAFPEYALNLSKAWEDTRETDLAAPSDKLTLSKEGYTVTISQIAAGGGVCLFAGDAPREMSQTFKTYVGIPGIHAQFRRGTSDNRSYTVCEKKGDIYEFPTSFGRITYSVPANPDPALLNEMDAMVASLNN